MRVRHFKGGQYEVVTLQARLEVDGADGPPHVVYRSVTDGKVWIRSLQAFFEHVDKPGYKGPRFTVVDETTIPPQLSLATDDELDGLLDGLVGMGDGDDTVE